MKIVHECKAQIIYFSELARLEKDEQRRLDLLARAHRWHALSREAEQLADRYADLLKAA